jgi:LPS-assembly protein
MKRLHLLPICIGAICSIHSNGEFLVDDVLVQSKENTLSCISYVPNIGEVKKNEDLEINSDKFQITDDKRLVLYGNVSLDFPEGLLKAQNAELDRENGKVKFSNSGEIFLTNFYFKSEDGYLNKDNNSIALNKGIAFSQERNLVFNFDKLEGNLDDTINLLGAYMSSCSNPDKGWLLLADEIVLDSQANRGLAKNIKIKAAGSTIFAFPYIPFATSDERMSGFLEPSVSYSSDGVDLMIPYYKVISSRSDITFAPRHIAKRGSGLEINYRALHGEKNNYRNLDIIYLNKDDEFKKETSNSDSSRWIYKFNDVLNLNHSIINIDWSKSSDGLVLRDIPGDITSIGYRRTQNLNQNVFIQTRFKNTKLTIEHQAYQSLNPILTNGYKKSPSLNLKYKKNINGFIFSEDLDISTFKANTIHGYFGYQTMDNNYLRLIENPDEGQRIFSDLSVSKIFNVNGFNVLSRVGIKSIDYNLTHSSKKTQSVNVPNALIDISSIYVNKYGSTINILKPRLIYGYTAYRNQDNNPVFDSNEISPNNELFINDRFSGMDRIGDQNFYTLSIDYSQMKMGMKKASLSISKKYYLKDRKVWMNPSMSQMDSMNSINQMSSMSPIMRMNMGEGPAVITASWMPSMNTMIMSYGGYLKDQKKMPLGGLTIKHKLKSGNIGYAYRFRRMAGDFNIEMNYSEFFADIDLNPNFKFIAKLKRDNNSNQNIESLLGIEYENCCLALRITGSDRNFSRFLVKEEILYPTLADAWDNAIDIESKSRINFEFEFKGLNSSFEKMNKLFKNSLFNY